MGQSLSTLIVTSPGSLLASPVPAPLTSHRVVPLFHTALLLQGSFNELYFQQKQVELIPSLDLEKQCLKFSRTAKLHAVFDVSVSSSTEVPFGYSYKKFYQFLWRSFPAQGRRHHLSNEGANHVVKFINCNKYKLFL